MQAQSRPWRSALYIPGSKPRALEKATGLAADAIIFDLEDAVSPDEKIAARGTLIEALGRLDHAPRARLVRVNGLDTPWGEDDIRALVAAGLHLDGLVIPKVGSEADLDAVSWLAPGVALWAMMETPRGILAADAIAAHHALAGMVMGTNDLARELGCRHRPDRLPMIQALSLCLLAARAHGRIIIDGVFNAFRDLEGLEAECIQGRDMGFDGKSLIHPDQLAVANLAFAPAPDEIALAHRQIAAHAQAVAAGQGVAVLDGRIVENLHVATAHELIARAEAIARLEGQIPAVSQAERV